MPSRRERPLSRPLSSRGTAEAPKGFRDLDSSGAHVIAGDAAGKEVPAR